jgi:hypothetical protein
MRLMRANRRALKTAAIVTVSAALGAGASLGVSACGEDREGDVEIEDGTTGGGTTGTTGGETTGTEGGDTTGGETEPETGTAP